MNAKYLFATIQTISKEENLHQFDPGLFDYILIDEVHKAGASSYHRVIDYFKPKFLMGMTATPERTDNFNIYELFDYNIAYEIRLQEALEEDMLCPFHYFKVASPLSVIKATEKIKDVLFSSSSNNELKTFSFFFVLFTNNFGLYIPG